jgi:hypothetical protein
VPTADVVHFEETNKEKLTLLNPYLGDYDNKQVSNSVMLTKLLSKIVE